MVDKSLPLSTRVSSSMKHRAQPPTLVLIVVPALRVCTGVGPLCFAVGCVFVCLLAVTGGVAARPRFCSCDGCALCPKPLPMLPEDVGQDHSIS